VVLKIEGDLEGVFSLLERVAWQYPEAVAVAVGDVPEAILADLAWDLGARYVLFPPQPRDLLLDVVAGLMAAVPIHHEPA
jgi:hypothetical protein